MRGKGLCRVLARLANGITPAHAGKRHFAPSVQLLPRDHPRPCGEKGGEDNGKCRKRGSPPPMRGKASIASSMPLNLRITPAHAGKSLRPARQCYTVPDHPRPCGEKYLSSIKGVSCVGSPPPMRGKARALCWSATAFRITPAHAGKSRCALAL